MKQSWRMARGWREGLIRMSFSSGAQVSFWLAKQSFILLMIEMLCDITESTRGASVVHWLFRMHIPHNIGSKFYLTV